MIFGLARLSFAVGIFLLPAQFVIAQEGPLQSTHQSPLDIRPVVQGVEVPPTPRVSAKPKSKPETKKDIAPALPVVQMAKSSENIATGLTKSGSASPVKTDEKANDPAPAPFDEMVLVKYCSHLSAAASEGRLAWQARQLEAMDAQLRARISELEKKRSELEDWLRRREESLRKADEALVAVYSKMKPDAAAQQFSAMDEAGAAAILIKLNPRMASTVLNEIDPSRAARIAAEMAGVAPPRNAARTLP